METTACNLCGADEPRPLYRNFGLDLSKCRRCGLIYAGPQRLTREATWERQSDTYFYGEYLPAMGAPDGRPDLESLDLRYARYLHWIGPYRRLGTLLEIGIGAGFFLKAAERAGWQVVGVDVMPAGAEYARAQLGLDVRTAAIEDADLPADAYDVVVMLDVLEHLSDPQDVLRRVWSLLRPGGCVAIRTPNTRSVSHWALRGQWSVMNPGEHLNLFDERTLRAMLGRAGFVDVSFDRHYATTGRYETMLPMHAFAPGSRRARTYRRFVDALPRWSLHPIQALGLADFVHGLGRRPE